MKAFVPDEILTMLILLLYVGIGNVVASRALESSYKRSFNKNPSFQIPDHAYALFASEVMLCWPIFLAYRLSVRAYRRLKRYRR